MKRILYFILGILLLPVYVFLKRNKTLNEKMQFGEKVVVVTRNMNSGKKTIIE